MSDIRDFTGKNRKFTGTSGVVLPKGNTAARVGSESGELRFNTETGVAEYYDGTSWKAIDSPPVVTSISPTSINPADYSTVQTITITGSLFSANPTVTIIGADDSTQYTPTSVTRDSESQITITTTEQLGYQNDPYSIKVTNISGLSSTLDDCLSVNDPPAFTTASGSLGTLLNTDRSGSNLTSITTNDEEGDSVTVSAVAGVDSSVSIPNGLTINSNGTWSGTADQVSSHQTYNFTLQASDGTTAVTRDYSITVRAPFNVSITGNLYESTANSLTFNVSNTSTVDIVFKEGETVLHNSYTSQDVSSGSITLSVPSEVYNQTVGDTITITVTDGTETFTTTKNILQLPTGGTTSSADGYNYHTFTSGGTFTVYGDLDVEYLIVAGGGGGGGGGGGAGAGGMRTGTASLTAQAYSISIGGGGGGGGWPSNGSQGGSSSAFGISSSGGGYGSHQSGGGSGGSGGGGGYQGGGGSGTSGQGNSGGSGINGGNFPGGGGGGKSNTGGNAPNSNTGGEGGGGGEWPTGSGTYYAGGGNSVSRSGGYAGTRGQSGGGGVSGSQSGQANTGGGGASGTSNTGGSGGSGIVIVRYLG